MTRLEIIQEGLRQTFTPWLAEPDATVIEAARVINNDWVTLTGKGGVPDQELVQDAVFAHFAGFGSSIIAAERIIAGFVNFDD